MHNSTLDANLGPFFTGLGSSVTEMGLFTNSIASKIKGGPREGFNDGDFQFKKIRDDKKGLHSLCTIQHSTVVKYHPIMLSMNFDFLIFFGFG